MERGRVSVDEAYRVLNMGFGMVLCVEAEVASEVERRLAAAGEPCHRVGRVVAGDREVKLS